MILNLSSNIIWRHDYSRTRLELSRSRLHITSCRDLVIHFFFPSYLYTHVWYVQCQLTLALDRTTNNACFASEHAQNSSTLTDQHEPLCSKTWNKVHHDVVTSFLALETSDGDPIDTTAAIRSWLATAQEQVAAAKDGPRRPLTHDDH